MPSPILFVDHAAGLGGAEHSLLLLLKHLPRQRWQPHLACTAGHLAAAAAALGVQVHMVDMPRLRRSARLPLDWLHTARRLAGIARQAGAALVHGNTVRASLYAAAAARLAGRPFLWHMRDFWLAETQPVLTWPDRWGKRLLCGLSAQVVANSQAVAAHLPCPAKTVVVPNGIEIDRFDPALDGQPFRRQHGIPASALVAGMVGRLRPWKGQEVFLHAAARVAEAIPDAHFVIAGGDPFGVQTSQSYAHQLQGLARSLGLAGRVHFTGQIDDVRPALAALDVFVHPGAPEPFGLVNLEAMAMARPVAAFAHGALPELVAPGETGLLVAPGDEQALAEAVAALLRDPARARDLGQAGRARAQAHFSIQRTVQTLEQVMAGFEAPAAD